MSRANRGVLLALLLLAAPARADVVDVTVSTLLTGRADTRDGQLHTIIPIYESVSALARLSVPQGNDLKIVFSGWGGVIFDLPRDQARDQNSNSWTGDIDVGYIEGSVRRERLSFRVGRHVVSGGAARFTAIDGATLSLRVLRGLTLTAYGGAPVTPRFAEYRGDVAAGGRLSYRFSPDTEVGASFHQTLDQGRMARQDAALDARFAATRRLTFLGYTLFSLREHRLAEADVSLQWQPLARPLVQVSADYRRTAPDLFLPLNSIFSVFSQETRDEFGGTVYVRPLPRLRLYGDYRAIRNEVGFGHRGGGKLSVALGSRDSTTIHTEIRVLKLPEKGYLQTRVYSLHQLHPAVLGTVGLDLYYLDQPIYNQRYSLMGTATVGWDVGHGFRIVGSAMADVTPFVERRMEFVLKLAYNATRRFREVH